MKIKDKITNKKLLINLFNSSLIFALILIVFLIANKSIEFGSKSGGWVYVYYDNLTIKPIIVFLFVFPYIVFFTYLSDKHIGKYEIYIIVLWFIIGFIIQLILRYDYIAPLGDQIESAGGTSFYTVTFRYSVYELLSNYESIAPTLPLHAKGNMAGKILFFYLLRIVTSSPQIMGLIIIIFSNIGGLLIYFISKFLFNNIKIALYSLILYLFIPAKIFFFPMLNTVSPVFILLPLFLMIKYFRTLKKVYLVFLGLSFYILFIFEPLPFVTGILFLSIVTYYLYIKKIKIKHLVALIGYAIFLPIITNYIVFWIFKYNAIDNFIYIFNYQAIFLAGEGRRYEIWVVQNLKNFFINLGFLQSIIFFIILSNILYGIIVKIKKFYSFKKVTQSIIKPGILLALSVFFIILILDLAGISRGEVIRIWIFIMAFFPVIVAYYCVKRKNSLTFYIVLLGNILQSAISISMVEF